MTVKRGRTETQRLAAMAAEADHFITEFAWAPPVSERVCCFAVGDVIAIYLFTFARAIDGTDTRLWVIVGDLPSAYLVVNDNDNPRQAAEGYCRLMEDWCRAVETGGSTQDLYPVAAEASLENAQALRARIGFIRSELLKDIPDAVV